jgi:anti-sigma-K factor RskA
MNYRHPERIDRLAAEYALGTLRGPARRRFERLLRDRAEENDMVRRRVKAWQDHLSPLDETLPPIPPAPHVWQAISKRLKLAPKRPAPWRLAWSSLHLWRGATLLVSVLALGLWVETADLRKPMMPTPLPVVAVLANDRSEAKLVVQFDPQQHTLTLNGLGTHALAPPADRAYEIWAIADAQPPVSLGVLPTTTHPVIQLDAARSAWLKRSGALAISVEPPGGSVTGAPTGPVVLTGALHLS